MSFLLGHRWHTTLPRTLPLRFALPLLLTLIVSGCQAVPDLQQTASLNGLRGEVELLRAQLSDTQASLEALRTEEVDQNTAVLGSLSQMDSRIGKLPSSVSAACANRDNPPASQQCEQQLIVSTDGRMLLGELEHVWLEPPGISLTARIDTGAESSSVNAMNLVEFERDGDDWVRFEWLIEGETTAIERPIERYVRVVQQADPDGTRRPVVSLRLRIGDTEDDFDFSLADRSHLDHQLNLGRNFLTDLAVVDVSRQFIQPERESEN